MTQRGKHGLLKLAFMLMLITLFIVSFSSFAAVNDQNSFVLKNLERERAALLNVFMREDLTFAQRQLKTKALLQRLAVVERMALNTDTSDNSLLAKQVFSAYELSFLLHASAEKNQNIMEHWLAELSLSQRDIEQGWAGER